MRPAPLPTRREILAASAAGSAAALGAAPLRSLWGLARTLASREEGAPVLVVVQLTGGNDGLNTVVPADDDLYHRARPRLRIAKKEAIPLGGALSLHPALAALRESWDRGELAIATGVGSPRPDRSHFRSMEMWHTASLAPEAPRSGWLGRAADRLGGPGSGAPALHVGSTESLLSLEGERLACASLVDLASAVVPVHGGADGARALAALAAMPRASEPAAWIAAEARNAYALAERIERAAKSPAAKGSYPASALGRKLRDVARLLEAGFPARIVEVELDGFDTHANQADAHAALLRELAEALAAFARDLAACGRARQVTTLCFSEFGRRTKENASGGTDHGAAAPVLLLGAHVRGGVHGGPPDLANLDDGDVAMTTDFRRVYATLLGRVLGLDPEPLLGGRFEPLPLL